MKSIPLMHIVDTTAAINIICADPTDDVLLLAHRHQAGRQTLYYEIGYGDRDVVEIGIEWLTGLVTSVAVPTATIARVAKYDSSWAARKVDRTSKQAGSARIDTSIWPRELRDHTDNYIFVELNIRYEVHRDAILIHWLSDNQQPAMHLIDGACEWLVSPDGFLIGVAVIKLAPRDIRRFLAEQSR
jgi:hypothetical protein